MGRKEKDEINMVAEKCRAVGGIAKASGGRKWNVRGCKSFLWLFDLFK